MSAVIYKTLDDLVNAVGASYQESQEITVILDAHIAIPFLKKVLNHKKNGVEFILESSCEAVLFNDLQNSEESNEPFMISILSGGVIVTEGFHSEYTPGAYADAWYFIDEKYCDRIPRFNPPHYSLFKTDFDLSQVM